MIWRYGQLYGFFLCSGERKRRLSPYSHTIELYNTNYTHCQLLLLFFSSLRSGKSLRPVQPSLWAGNSSRPVVGRAARRSRTSMHDRAMSRAAWSILNNAYYDTPLFHWTGRSNASLKRRYKDTGKLALCLVRLYARLEWPPTARAVVPAVLVSSSKNLNKVFPSRWNQVFFQVLLYLRFCFQAELKSSFN